MALQLDGSGQYAHSLALTGLPANAAPLTLAVRFNAQTLGASQQVLAGLGKDTFTTFGYIELMLLSSGRIRGRLRNGSGGISDAETTNAIGAGGWHHAAIVFASATDRRAYLDADAANLGSSTASATTGNTPDTIKFGKRPTGSPIDFFNGHLFAAALWKEALSEGELRAHRDGLHPLLIRPQALVDAWEFLDPGSLGRSLLGKLPLTLAGAPGGSQSPKLVLPGRWHAVGPAGGTPGSSTGGGAATLPPIAAAGTGSAAPPLATGSRGLSAGFVEQTLARALRPVAFVAVQSASGVARLWSGYGSLTWGGEEWTGAGHLLGISPVQETGDVQALGASFSLSGVPQSLLSLVLSDIRQNKPVRYWVGMLDEAGAVVADPYLAFDGRLDVPEIHEGGDTATITITAESRLIDLERPRERRYTPEDQRIEFPGDRGLDFVASLQDAAILWGRG